MIEVLKIQILLTLLALSTPVLAMESNNSGSNPGGTTSPKPAAGVAGLRYLIPDAFLAEVEKQDAERGMLASRFLRAIIAHNRSQGVDSTLTTYFPGLDEQLRKEIENEMSFWALLTNDKLQQFLGLLELLKREPKKYAWYRTSSPFAQCNLLGWTVDGIRYLSKKSWTDKWAVEVHPEFFATIARDTGETGIIFELLQMVRTSFRGKNYDRLTESEVFTLFNDCWQLLMATRGLEGPTRPFLFLYQQNDPPAATVSRAGKQKVD